MSGTVWRRPDGTWAYRVSLGKKPDGSLHRRQRNGFRTKGDAEAALVAALSERSKGVVVVSSAQTVADFLESWLVATQSSVRPSTHAQYAHVLRSWVVPHVGAKRLSELRPMDVQNLYTLLSTRGKKGGAPLSAASVNSAHRILRQALDQAVAWQLLSNNPATSKLKRPRMSKVPAAYWTPAQAKGFLRVHRGHRLYPLFVLMLTSGVRRGEAVGLRWQDVDLAERQITIVHTRVMARSKVVESTPKTASGHRVVELGDNAVAVLEKHRANTDGTGYVFTNSWGKPLHPDTLRASLNVAARKAGLPPLTPKGFRHTAASCALASGVHPKKVSEMLGHSNIQITLDTYSHVIQGQHRDAANALDTALFGDDE